MTGEPVSDVVSTVAWILLGIVVLANVAGAFLVAHDKRRAGARPRRRRVPERRLVWLALLGGWPLMGLAMLAWRHKTRKKRFLARFWAAATPTLVLAVLATARWLL